MMPDFLENLTDYMRLSGVKTKSEAVRRAIREAVERLRPRPHATDFESWRGLGNRAPKNAKPRFRSQDDLWKPQDFLQC